MNAPDRETPSTSWAVWAWQAYRDGRLVEASETHTPLADAHPLASDRIKALVNEAVLGKAAYDGVSSLLLSVQQDCIKERQRAERLEAALREIAKPYAADQSRLIHSGAQIASIARAALRAIGERADG